MEDVCRLYWFEQSMPKGQLSIAEDRQVSRFYGCHELLIVMDAFSNYHQIPLAKEDQELKTFIVDNSLYCYNVMSFGLKNTKATYQCLVNKVFTALIGKTMEVYVNDMITKSVKGGDLQDIKALWNEAEP